MERFLAADALTGEEWMALRQIAFGAQSAVVPAPTRRRLIALGYIYLMGSEIVLTRRGREMLAL